MDRAPICKREWPEGLPDVSDWEDMEARAGIEPAIEVLQTSALPLGYRARPLGDWVICD